MKLSSIEKKIRSLFLNERSNYAWGIPNPRSSDIYLASYPKSGNTWMRYLLAYSIWPELEELDLFEMAAYIPSFELKHDVQMMLNKTAPCNSLKHRIIKQHSQYNKLAGKHARRSICLVRDGRDALVSYWYFCNQRDQTNLSFRDFIEVSAKAEHSYGPWRSHVMGWMNANLESKLIIRYEDMLHDPAECVAKALRFAEINVPEQGVENAVRRASFNELKKLERSRGFNLKQLRTVEFVRQGKKGSWQDVFESGDLELFDRCHGGSIPELGYTW